MNHVKQTLFDCTLNTTRESVSYPVCVQRHNINGLISDALSFTLENILNSPVLNSDCKGKGILSL